MSHTMISAVDKALTMSLSDPYLVYVFTEFGEDGEIYKVDYADDYSGNYDRVVAVFNDGVREEV